MRKTLRMNIGIALWSLIGLGFLLSGCAGALRLHDESKAKTAAAIKEKYGQADVLGILEVEKKNLDNLLAEEIKVVRDNQKLQVDFALLRIADDNRPMAETYTKRAVKRLRELGYSGGFKRLRQFRLADIDLATEDRVMRENGELIEAVAGTAPPPCLRGVPLPEKIEFPDHLTEDQRKGARSFYKTYSDACKKAQNISEPTPPAGYMKQAFDEWQTAQGELAKLDQPVSEARMNFITKKEAYDRALDKLARAKESGAAIEKQMREAADLLKKDLEALKGIKNFIERKSAAAERADAIIVLLAAAAGTEIDTSDSKVKKAASVAGAIPSLAGDIRGLAEQARAPSVTNLLIELNHQVVLLEYTNRLRTLAQQRVDILKTRYDAFKEESRLWLRFGDAICSYAMVSANKGFPGEECDNFNLSPDGKTPTTVP